MAGRKIEFIPTDGGSGKILVWNKRQILRCPSVCCREWGTSPFSILYFEQANFPSAVLHLSRHDWRSSSTLTWLCKVNLKFHDVSFQNHNAVLQIVDLFFMLLIIRLFSKSKCSLVNFLLLRIKMICLPASGFSPNVSTAVFCRSATSSSFHWELGRSFTILSN